jgi:malate synthase
MVDTCKAVFDEVLGTKPNQLDKLREDVRVTADQLLDVGATPGEVTEAGLRSNVSVAIQYLAAWLEGTGAVGIFNLMEDAATAEISRSQIWQWRHNKVVLDTGSTVTTELVSQIADEEIAKLGDDPERYAAARKTFLDVATAEEYVDFLTLPAYEIFP